MYKNTYSNVNPAHTCIFQKLKHLLVIVFPKDLYIVPINWFLKLYARFSPFVSLSTHTHTHKTVAAEITIKLIEVQNQFIFSHLHPTSKLLTRNKKQIIKKQGERTKNGKKGKRSMHGKIILSPKQTDFFLFLFPVSS